MQLTELVGVPTVRVGVGTLGLVLLQEVRVGDGWEGSSLVNDRSLVDLLVDGLGVVNGGRLDSLSLNDGLDCCQTESAFRTKLLTGLVDVVVLVGVDVSTEVSGRSLSLSNVLLVSVSGSLFVQLGLVLWEHVLLVLSNDSWGGGLDMLGGENLVVFDGLDSVLVVVDVSLSVDGLGSLDVLLWSDLLLNDLWGDLRADLGVRKRPV